MGKSPKTEMRGMTVDQSVSSYPPARSDEELFGSPSEMQQVMEDFGLTEDQARRMRALNLA